MTNHWLVALMASISLWVSTETASGQASLETITTKDNGDATLSEGTSATEDLAQKSTTRGKNKNATKRKRKTKAKNKNKRPNELGISVGSLTFDDIDGSTSQYGFFYERQIYKLWTMRISAGFAFNYWEFDFTNNATTPPEDQTIDSFNYGLYGRVSLFRVGVFGESWVAPYVIGGLGQHSVNVNNTATRVNNASSGISFDGGAGLTLQTPLNEKFSFAFSIDYLQRDLNLDDSNLYHSVVGLKLGITY